MRIYNGLLATHQQHGPSVAYLHLNGSLGKNVFLECIFWNVFLECICVNPSHVSLNDAIGDSHVSYSNQN